jgi:hypothetical protein
MGVPSRRAARCLSSDGSVTGFLDRCADKLGETSARVSMKESRQ